MIRLFIYSAGMVWWISAIHGFHLEKELKPLLKKDTNRLELRSELNKHNFIKVRIVEVVRRDPNGVPAEFFEKTFFECGKCNKDRLICSCSTASLPSVKHASSPPQLRKTETPQRSPEHSPVRLGPTSPLLRSAVRPEPRNPNRLMQAFAACISCPQLFCALCASAEDLEMNSYYDEYVSPFGLPEAHREDRCCECLFTFCPCCVPQEEL